MIIKEKYAVNNPLKIVFFDLQKITQSAYCQRFFQKTQLICKENKKTIFLKKKRIDFIVNFINLFKK